MSNERGESIDDMIRSAWANDSPTGWFEPLYARAKSGEMNVPWASREPHPLLVDWLQMHDVEGEGLSALVVGCGLGDDAELLAQIGYDVTAFDVSASAILWARERFPQSSVKYQVADLLQAPDAWEGAFDFVLEVYTIQALPNTLSTRVMGQISSFVAPGGWLLAICHGREPHESNKGVPWPLSRNDLAKFESFGLELLELDDFAGHGLRMFRALYRRPAA
jgi:SAM-dependent methyltransferase